MTMFDHRFAGADEENRGQMYYDAVKERFAYERDIRLHYRPEGTDQYFSDFEGEMLKYGSDPFSRDRVARDPIVRDVEVLVIGAGFSALLVSARLRQAGVESIQLVERAADVGGTWYWNRYPGVACDVPSYDYLPLLDELDYVPTKHYAEGDEIFQHCRKIAEKYDLYKLAIFQTTVVSTSWHDGDRRWHVTTDRHDTLRARFVICANGTSCKPKLTRIEGMETFAGVSFHTSRWDYEYTGRDLERLADKTVGIIGTGATAVQAVPNLAKAVRELYVFQRTPSSIDIREDWPTDPNWARKLPPGWQSERRAAAIERSIAAAERKKSRPPMDAAERIRQQENQNIDYMMRIHRRIEEIVKDPATAEALKPWYMFMCKRPCFHNDYLASFNLPNVHLVDTAGRGITRIGPSGPEFEGKTYPLDLLIYATGFEVLKTGIYNEIRGMDGVELQEKYADGVRTLFGVHTQGFPNFFVMGGQQASFEFNLTQILQTEGDHIAYCIAYARDHNYESLDVTTDSEEWWVREVIAHRGKTNREQECTPGYYNLEGQNYRRQDGNYNGGFAAYYTHIQNVERDMEKHFNHQ